MKAILLLALLLCPLRAGVEKRELFLEPDYSTLRINLIRTAYEPCTAWPIRDGEPQPYYLRGIIRDADGWAIGRYVVHGVLRNSEGANVTDHELFIKGLPKIIYGLDAEPLVDGYVIDGEFKPGLPYQLQPSPIIEPGCTWGLRWRVVVTIGAQ